MSEHHKHITPYTGADIQKYLNGELSPVEMHAIEKAALDDPFLAEAIEGMELVLAQSGADQLKKDLAEIPQRLKQRVEPEKPSVIASWSNHWWKIAALLIVVAGGALFLFRSTPKQNDITAVKKEVTTPAPPRIMDTIAVASPAATETDSAGGTEAMIQKAVSTPKDTSGFQKTADLARLPKIVKTKNDSIAVADRANGNLSPVPSPTHENVENALSGRAAGVIITQKGRRDFDKLRTRQTPSPPVQNFAGKITDSNNIAIPYATVLLKNSKGAVSTDANGFFSLNVTRPDTIALVSVNAIGYMPTDIRLSNNPLNNMIRLKTQSTSLNEVVIAGYGAQKKEQEDTTESEDTVTDDQSLNLVRKQKVIVQKAMPSIGWNEYKTYLDTHKKIAAADPGHADYEVISFKVNRAGEISSFKIEKSISPAHDAEAISLVKQGPSWKLLSGKSARATLIITY